MAKYTAPGRASSPMARRESAREVRTPLCVEHADRAVEHCAAPAQEVRGGGDLREAPVER